MNQRIHRHLDGELPRAALSEEERREAQAYRLAIRGALSPILDERPPDVSASVMAGLPSTPPAGRRFAGWSPRSLAAWLLRPRPLTLRVRPAWGLALAAVLAIAIWRPGPDAAAGMGTPIQSGGTVMASSSVDGRVLVVFRLDAPGARSVRLAGDFTGWEAGPELTQATPGVWTVVVPIDPGLHDYAFIVDGTRWVQDPLAERVDDGFGGSNSRVAVLSPSRLEQT
ncbi:MAG TPA: glycogen-binding domain-containing protein [Longimicrobiales bacterium]|nr:glycogen-binding domain-containing protein [Longimicrobiales bacterium]